MTILRLNSLDKDSDDIVRNNYTINYQKYNTHGRKKYYIDATIIYMCVCMCVLLLYIKILYKFLFVRI